MTTRFSDGSVFGRLFQAGNVPVAAIVAALAFAAGPFAEPADAAEPPLIAREGSVASPAKAGIAPARDLRQATFRVELDSGTTRTTVRLGAVPTAATTSDLWIMWGEMDNGTCQITEGSDSKLSTDQTGEGEVGSDAYWTREGAEITAVIGFAWGPEEFDCGVVATMPTDSESPDPSQAYDTAVARLDDVHAPPRGALRSKLSGAPLYAGAWATVRVRVRNPGTGPVTGARLKVSGKRIKPASKRVGKIGAGKSRLVKVRVKARRGAKKRRLKITLAGRGPAPITDRKSYSVEVRAQGRRPKAGRYVGNNGRVSFRVTPSGAVKRIRLRVVGVCNPGAHTWAEWKTLPKARINRYGWVDRRYSHGKGVSSWAAWLTARFVRGRALEGHYRYVTSLCEAEVKFKARRVGR